MDDFCDCSQCPHHCGGDEEEIIEADKTNATVASDDTTDADADSVEASIETSIEDSISTPEDPSDAKVLAGKKVDSLKKDILDLGFKLEETGDGIRVTL